MDEEMRYSAAGGKGEVLLGNLEAFFMPQGPANQLDRCRSPPCLRRTPNVILLRSEGLIFFVTCFKEHCEQNLVDIKILQVVGITVHDMLTRIKCAKVVLCHDHSRYLHEGDARRLLELLFKTSMSATFAESLEALEKREPAAVDEQGKRWNSCVDICTGTYGQFTNAAGSQSLGRFHLNKYLLKYFYGHEAVTRGLGEPKWWIETFQMAAEAYDNLPAATISLNLSEWIQEQIASTCHQYLLKEFGIITASRLEHVYGMKRTRAGRREDHFVEMTTAEEEAIELGTTLEKMKLEMEA